MDNLKVTEELRNIQVTLAEVSTTMKLGFIQHSEQLKEQAGQLKELNSKTEMALLPIKLGRALVAVVGGASVISGCFYGVYKFISGSGGP